MAAFDPSHLPTGHLREHPSRGQAPYSHRKRSGSHALPIPDLRFEQSYLRSLRRFVHDSEDANGTGTQRKESGESVQTAGRDPALKVATPGLYGIPLRFNWGSILYITTRDQLLSPFAQGAIWALASHFLRPFLRSIGAWVRIHFWRSWRSIFPPLEPHVHGGVSWMRDQFRGFTVGGLGSNVSLSK